MSTHPAPLLTQDQARGLLTYDPSVARPQLQALADGRTACVRVMSEDECRAEFHKVMGDDSPKLDKEERAIYDNEWRVWLACARAMGAVR